MNNMEHFIESKELEDKIDLVVLDDLEMDDHMGK